MTTPNDPNNPRQRDIYIESEQISVSGDFIVSGGNTVKTVYTGGNVDSKANMRVTVGGVETTRQQVDQMVTRIQAVQETIQTEASQGHIDPNEQEVAEQSIATIQQQVTQERKLNPLIFTNAIKVLYHLSPAIAGTVVSLLSEPLIGQIMMMAGQVAINLVDSLTQSKPGGNIPQK